MKGREVETGRWGACPRQLHLEGEGQQEEGRGDCYNKLSQGGQTQPYSLNAH